MANENKVFTYEEVQDIVAILISELGKYSDGSTHDIGTMSAHQYNMGQRKFDIHDAMNSKFWNKNITSYTVFSVETNGNY